MRVGPARHQAEPALDQPLRERLRVVEDALLVLLELRPQRLAEGDRLGGDDVLERPALDAGEDVRVHRLGVLLLAQDQPGAGPAQRLVGGGGDRVGERHRAGVEADGHQAGDVRDVADHHRARLLGDLAQPHEVERARIRRRAAEDGAGPDLLRQLARGGEIDGLGLGVQPVVVDLEELAGEVHRGAVREVAALGERQREDAVPGPQQGEVRGHVRLRPGVRLDVGVLGAEERLGAVDGELLDLVDHLAPAEAFGVLVGQRRSGRLEHRLGDEVLAGDQLEPVGLPRRFLADQLRDFRVDGGQRLVERIHLVSIPLGPASYHTVEGLEAHRGGAETRRDAVRLG